MIHMHTYIQTHIHTYIHTYTHTYIWSQDEEAWLGFMTANAVSDDIEVHEMVAWDSIHTYTHAYIHIHMHAYFHRMRRHG